MPSTRLPSKPLHAALGESLADVKVRQSCVAEGQPQALVHALHEVAAPAAELQNGQDAKHQLAYSMYVLSRESAKDALEQAASALGGVATLCERSLHSCQILLLARRAACSAQVATQLATHQLAYSMLLLSTKAAKDALKQAALPLAGRSTSSRQVVERILVPNLAVRLQQPIPLLRTQSSQSVKDSRELFWHAPCWQAPLSAARMCVASGEGAC